MSANNPTRDHRKASGKCIDCGDYPPTEGRVRCEPCASKNRTRNRGSYQRADRKPYLPPSKPDDKGDMIRFIRGQHDIAVPLLAKLYSLPEADIRKIRANAFRSSLGRDRMPIKLLQELVDQRQERLSPEDFAASSSSMALCENEA